MCSEYMHSQMSGNGEPALSITQGRLDTPGLFFIVVPSLAHPGGNLHVVLMITGLLFCMAYTCSLCDLLFCVMLLRFEYVVACGYSLFIFIPAQYFIATRDHSWPVHLTVEDAADSMRPA